MMEAVKTSAPTPGTSNSKSQASASAPRLVIRKQPQTAFKYRYESELNSSHGYLYSETYEQSTDKKNTPKTYPEVMLENYESSRGKVIIQASLVQEKSNDKHLNILAPNGINKMELSNNIASFEKLCIKRITTEELQIQRPDLSKKKITMLRKRTNMHSGRIKFSAIYSVTKKEICSPVYSNPIYNKKIQNKQKIFFMSLFRCDAKGGKECIMVTSPFAKANSKTDDIRVSFYTETSEGQISWEVDAKIEDIIQNYALRIIIPAYKDVNIKQIVSAKVQLVRPSDGAVSEPLKFEYAPNRQPKHKTTNGDTNNNSTITPQMTPGRACEPIMQEGAAQLRQESDERHCPGIHQRAQGIISDQRLDEEINQTTNQSYETQNFDEPTQNFNKPINPLATERDPCLSEADGQGSPARQQFVEKLGQDNFDEVPLHTRLEDLASVLANNVTEPQRDRREDLRNFLDDIRVRFNTRTSEGQLSWVVDAHIEDIIQNYARTIRTAYEDVNMNQRSVCVQWVRPSDGAAVSEPMYAPYRLVNHQMPNGSNPTLTPPMVVTPDRAREPIMQGTEPLNETWEDLLELLEAECPNLDLLRLADEFQHGDNTQRSHSSDETFDNSTTAAQVREEFSDGPAPKKKRK